MSVVVDLSPGTRLRACTTGWVYTVQACGDDRVILSGPRGSVSVDRDELQAGVARGRVEVIS